MSTKASLTLDEDRNIRSNTSGRYRRTDIGVAGKRSHVSGQNAIRLVARVPVSRGSHPATQRHTAALPQLRQCDLLIYRRLSSVVARNEHLRSANIAQVIDNSRLDPVLSAIVLPFRRRNAEIDGIFGSVSCGLRAASRCGPVDRCLRANPQAAPDEGSKSASVKLGRRNCTSRRVLGEALQCPGVDLFNDSWRNPVIRLRCERDSGPTQHSWCGALQINTWLPALCRKSSGCICYGAVLI